MLLELGLDDVEIVEAYSLQQGYELGITETIDGFVIDRHVRRQDGLDLVRRLRHDRRTNRAPIIVLTAKYDPADEAMVLRAGADAYLAKPFSPETISAYIRAVIEIPASERRERRASDVQRLLQGTAPAPLLDLTDAALASGRLSAESGRRLRLRRRATAGV